AGSLILPVLLGLLFALALALRLICPVLGSGFLQGGGGAAEPGRYPGLPLRHGAVAAHILLLGLIQLGLHRFVEALRGLDGILGDLDRLADADDQLRALGPEVSLAALGPDALGTPDRDRDQRRTGIAGDDRRPLSQFFDLEGTGDRRLGEDPHQLAGL